MKKIVFIQLLLCFLGTNVYSQDYAVDKFGQNISMLGGFSSSGGDLFEDSRGHRKNQVYASAVYNVFIFKSIFVGLGFDYLSAEINNINSVNMSIGPNIGYAFGDSKSKLYPFITSGFRFTIDDDDRSVPYSYSGNDLKIGGGVIFPVQKYIGIIMELDYHLVNLKKDSDKNYISGNYFNISFGISGLLF